MSKDKTNKESKTVLSVLKWENWWKKRSRQWNYVMMIMKELSMVIRNKQKEVKLVNKVLFKCPSNWQHLWLKKLFLNFNKWKKNWKRVLRKAQKKVNQKVKSKRVRLRVKMRIKWPNNNKHLSLKSQTEKLSKSLRLPSKKPNNNTNNTKKRT